MQLQEIEKPTPIDNIKSTIRAIPLLGNFLVRIHNAISQNKFTHSGNYWEERYQAGGNSGAGSYGRLAEFKADVINTFIAENKITSVVELGCGDGAQLKRLNIEKYTGIDISKTIVDQANTLYKTDKNKTFQELSSFINSDKTFETAMSLDVIYHLVEDNVFENHMKLLFSRATKFVIIYASNKDEMTSDPHVRHRKFTDWISENQPNWQLIEKKENPYPFSWKDPRNTSFADFYLFKNCG